MLILLQRLVQLVVFVVIALVGLVMATVFVASTIVAVMILVVVARLRGKSFSAKEYWMARSAKRKPILKSGSFSTKNSADVTDVKARDIS
ncbi:MAG: hypothetical protein CK528_11360 [Alcaligenaceae bacterium]|nr:MAG: hypothetical protein CK528_11360 [Alcaligenaceae bacterium]